MIDCITDRAEPCRFRATMADPGGHEISTTLRRITGLQNNVRAGKIGDGGVKYVLITT